MKDGTGKDDGVKILNICDFTCNEMKQLATGTKEDRLNACTSISDIDKEKILTPVPMTFLEELFCLLFLGLTVPLGVFSIPILLCIIGKYLVGNIQSTFITFGILMIPLIVLPQPYIPSMQQSYMASLIIKYFSYRFIYEELPPTKNTNDPNYHPRIMVAPPHGVFPYGNILAILTYPTICGHSFRGIASSAALRPPIFKQVLRSIGIIDASRHIARNHLEDGGKDGGKWSLGISTGGVAEVFETNANDECIVLKERIGLIKLAIRTGADLVPCYLFGNTKLLSCWIGEGIPYGRTVLERISRKLGFATILVRGRFGLPIPRRIPVLAVMGKGIPTHHIQKEDPTNDDIQQIQTKLLNEMDAIFNKYKSLYGWEEKQLIIK